MIAITKWEYALEPLPYPKVTSGAENHADYRKNTLRVLNSLGYDGWELISIHPAGDGWLGVLKRPKD